MRKIIELGVITVVMLLYLTGRPYSVIADIIDGDGKIFEEDLEYGGNHEGTDPQPEYDEEIHAASTGNVIEDAIRWAEEIANCNSHGYSQENRWGPDYDCSSFVISAFREAGLSLTGASTTGNMLQAFEKEGFTCFLANDLGANDNSQQLIRGDILLRPKTSSKGGHTEIYVGSDRRIGAHKDYDGVSGDSTGKEISEVNYAYSDTWTYVLRYPNPIPVEAQVEELRVIAWEPWGYMVECKVNNSDVLSNVTLANWPESQGGENARWEPMVLVEKNTYRLYVSYSWHGDRKETYFNDVYFDVGLSSMQDTGHRVTFDNRDPVVEELKVIAWEPWGYMVECKVNNSDVLSNVTLANWPESQGGENARWEPMALVEKNTYRLYVSYSWHGDRKETYFNDVYFDVGLSSMQDTGHRVTFDNRDPVVEELRVIASDAWGYMAECIVNNSDVLHNVTLANWPESLGGGNARWEPMVQVEKNKYRLYVNYSWHENRREIYYNDVYFDVGLSSESDSGRRVFFDNREPCGYDQEIPDGDYIIVTACTSNKAEFYYLDINGVASPAEDGMNIHLHGPVSKSDDVREADAWTVTYDDGFYTIRQKGTNAALDVADASRASGANIQAWTLNDSDAQKWAVSKNGSNGYSLQAKCSGLFLDVEGGVAESGTNVQQHIKNDSAAQSWLFIPYQPSQTLENGKYIILSDVNNRFELDVPGETGDVADQTELWLWDDGVKSKYNAFEFTKLSNGYYKVIHSASGKAMEVYGGGSDPNDTRISLLDWNGSLAQQWAITKDGVNGGYVLRVRSSGYAVDLTNALTENGAPVRQFYYNGTAAETWKFVPAEYTVKYDANGGTGAPGNQTKYYKEDILLSSSEPLRDGYEFKGWTKTKTATTAQFMPGATYSTDADVTLYAVWKLMEPDFILPASLTTIEEEAFEGGAFTCVRLGENVEKIESKAFANCLYLQHIYIPEATTTIAADAFSGVAKSMIIHGIEGSYAEFYANKYGFQFVDE